MAEESKAQGGDSPPPKRGRQKRVVVIAVILVVGIGGSAAGSIYGQQLLGGAKAATAESHGEGSEHGEKKSEKAEKEEKEEGPGGEIVSLDAIIVDLRASDGDLHHLKVGLAVELRKPLPEEEVKRLSPRARDAAITYLRSLTLDDVTNVARFEEIRQELFEKIAQGMGKSRVKTVLFTDFVAQ